MTALGKLGSCEICSSKAAIYKCPKCEMVTCSLECSKRHKRLKNFCDGIRDKTKYVPLKKFGYMELVSGNFNYFFIYYMEKLWNCS